MPAVKDGETRDEYLKRCIPVCMKEGLTQEQAVGKCEGMYSNKQKGDSITKHLGK